MLWLQVVPADEVEDWHNHAEISGATDAEGNPVTDADSTPDTDNTNDGDIEDNAINGENGDEDDHDIAEIIVGGDVGDTVWKDLDGNGIQDPGEPGVAGVTVHLYACDGTLLETTTTDANGNYLFTAVPPGDYYVQFDISGLPAGCDFTTPGLGTDANNSDADANGTTACFTTDGTDYLDVDAGLVPLAGLGNYVWFDADGDGIQDPNEMGIGGVLVNLYDQDGNFIASTHTDANGMYLFTDLYPGHYYLEFAPPAGYDTTQPNAGGSDNTDSDLDGTNGANTTASTWLDAGELDLSWDAGFHTCVEIGDVLWLSLIHI